MNNNYLMVDLNINSIYCNEQLNDQSVYSYSYLLLVLDSNILYYIYISCFQNVFYNIILLLLITKLILMA